jgi:hypothetical protein
VIKDVFARATKSTIPTNQSVAMGIRQDFPIGQKTNLQFDFQARELWQAVDLHQFDFLPSMSFTRVVNPRVILFGSSVLQMRGGQYFVAPTREIDPFYSIGGIFRKGKWNFVVSNTFNTNFRDPPFRGSIPSHGNVVMISDFEINHPISSRLPGVVAFVRAEPVWNWRGDGIPGLSGFDFRLFTGIRLAVTKPAYTSAMHQLRKQIYDQPPPKSSSTRGKQQDPDANQPSNQQSNQQPGTQTPVIPAPQNQISLPRIVAPTDSSQSATP